MNSDVLEVKLSLKDIPKLFDYENTGVLRAKDIIAYVRGKLNPDPWTKIILNTKSKPVEIKELENASIFWKDFNDDVSNTLGISTIGYCVIDVDSLDFTKEDFTIPSKVNDFLVDYNMSSAIVLLTCDINKLDSYYSIFEKIGDYILESGYSNVYIPSIFIKKRKLLSNGYDISPYSEEIELNRQRNNLSYKTLIPILEKISGDVVSGQTMIQDLREKRTFDVKLLTNYLILKYNLPPAYVKSFLADYIEKPFVYPRTKLSLFERLNFLKKMPQLIGYITAGQDLLCMGIVLSKIWPKPYIIFDLEDKMQVLNRDDFLFNNPDLNLIDYRTLFPESQNPIIGDSIVGVVKNKDITEYKYSSSSDCEVNMKLIDLFDELSNLVDEDIYISVKNSVLAVKGGRRYLIYCPEELGIKVELRSEYFGAYQHVIPEGNFQFICDAQIARAILAKERETVASKSSVAMVKAWNGINPSIMLRPAIDYDISLFMYMLPFGYNGLSFFDTGLRCCVDVLPIVTSIDSALYDLNSLLTYLSLKSLRKDKQSRYAISCFGTLITGGNNTTLPITYKAFTNRRLFE